MEKKQKVVWVIVEGGCDECRRSIPIGIYDSECLAREVLVQLNEKEEKDYPNCHISEENGLRVLQVNPSLEELWYEQD